MRRFNPAALLLATLCMASVARADTEYYTYIDANGMSVFTNRDRPKGKAGQHWKKAFDSGPGKAATVSGAWSPTSVGAGGGGAGGGASSGQSSWGYSSYAGCKKSHIDAVPARDRSPDRYSRYDPYIAAASRMYAIPESLIRAVIKVESDYDPNVVSCAGAKGLMQVMPYEEKSERIEHVFDPWQNIAAATRVLRRNANRWNGDLVKTIASYHAGCGAVNKYGGVPPYATTQFYVRSVLKQYEKFKQRELARAE